MTPDHSIQLCVCQSNKPFNKCCGRFLDTSHYPKTPEQLMRSRYCAYALGGYGDYLLATWLPVMAPKLSGVQLSRREYDWYKLEVLGKGQSGDDAWVEFKAHHRDLGSDDDQVGEILHERSVFKRINGQWLYVGGEIH